jgi:hypothetical protein
MIVYSGMIYSLCVTLGVTGTPHEILSPTFLCC